MLYKVVYAQFTPTVSEILKLLYRRLHLKINTSVDRCLIHDAKSWTLETGMAFKLGKQDFSCTNNEGEYRTLK